VISAELRDLNAPTWDAAVGHRFVDEIWRGDLDPAVLRAYLVQDHQFVDAFVALMGAAVATAGRPQSRLVHARQLGMVAGPESDFFTRALDALDVPLADHTGPEPRDFLALMDSARIGGDYAVCVAVLLVAEWLYLDWATRPEHDPPAEPIQREWIELHRGPAFEEWVGFLRGELDWVAPRLDDAGQERVRAAFTRAVELEPAFFDAAYR
jgi:thiaminase/transcriptional activator TenA